MSKEEFYNEYIKDDRTEDEKMRDIIHQQAQRRRMNELMERKIREIERKKKQKRNDKITMVLTIAVVVGLVVALYSVSKAGVESCIKAGHSESWCVVNG